MSKFTTYIVGSRVEFVDMNNLPSILKCGVVIDKYTDLEISTKIPKDHYLVVADNGNVFHVEVKHVRKILKQDTK